MKYRKILITLAVLSVSAVIGATFAAPSYASITPVAFQCQCGDLWNWTGDPGVNGGLGANEGTNTLVASEGMAADTSPSEVVPSNGDTVGAFQGADGDLWTWGVDGVANTGRPEPAPPS